MKTITVSFDKDGNPQIETEGFVGGACLTETLALEAALGKKVADVKKPEAYAKAAVAPQLKAKR